MPALMLETKEQAVSFMDELEHLSTVARYRIVGSYDEAPYGRAQYSAAPSPLLPRSVNGLPPLIIMHYTAGPTLNSTVAWFCKASLNSQRTAHFVIAQDKQALFSETEWKVFPRAAQLPAIPIICRNVQRPAVHATWTNGISVGIELVNLGCEVSSPIGRTRTLAKAAGRTWEQYSAAQIETAGVVVRALRLLCPAVGLDAVLGHEHVQGAQTPNVLEDKRDPGPLFPWPTFRESCRLSTDPAAAQDMPTYARDLERLGYYMRGNAQQPVRIFQYMMGLTCDGVAGPKTQAAIRQRLQDRGLAASA